MSKVFVDLGMSLDGFVAGPNAGPKNPLGDRGTSIHAWIYNQRVFMQHLKLGDGGGETGLDNRMLEATFGRIGPTSWENACSRKVKPTGRKRRPSTPRCSF